MTAICGWVWSPSIEIAERNCRSALEVLAPYGSRRPFVRSAGSAAFGIDPVHSASDENLQVPFLAGPTLLVADLRIDNRDELAEALRLAPRDAARRTDPQLLAAGWDRWRADVFGKLIGDFAVAVYSQTQETLWLARSLASTRPLFYSRSSVGTGFASLPNALWAHESFRRGLDLERLALGLNDGMPDGHERSLLRGIERVLPNRLIAIDAQGTSSKPIWEPDYKTLRLATAADYSEAYRDVLDTAVASRMASSGEVVAVPLSAGFDSNAVLGSAAHLAAPVRLIALTAAPRLGYKGPTHRGKLTDESALAGLAADRHGIEHLVVRPVGQALDHLASQVPIYQDPFRNIVNSGWDRQLRLAAAERGANVLLTGDLGNLTLNAGGPYVLGDFVSRREWGRWLSEARAALNNFSWQSAAMNSFERWVPRPITSFFDEHLRRIGAPSGLTFVRREWLDRLQSMAQAPPARLRNTYEERFEAIAAFDPGLVRKGQFAETGTDVRDPLTDRRVIQFSLSLPPEYLFSSGQPYPLARTALKDRVPSAILDNRIRGYQSADWHERMGPAYLREMVEEIRASDAARELIDFRKLVDALDHWPEDDLDRDSVIRRYLSYLPMTLAAGYFCVESERAWAASAGST